MKILLDTHILLWYLHDDSRLSRERSQIIEDEGHTKFISYVSIWEMSIKKSIGKLELFAPPETLIPEDITLLYPNLEDITVLSSLPMHHRDPFDRMIIAQSINKNLKLMSSDPHFEKYFVQLL